MDAKTTLLGVARIALVSAVVSTNPAFASEALSTPGRLPPDLRVTKIPADRLELSWQPSGSPAAVDYGIYEGHVASK